METESLMGKYMAAKTQTIAAKIRALRISNRFTREQVCQILAIPMQEYVELEEGTAQITEARIQDFMNLYGVERSQLTRTRVLNIVKDKDDDDALN